MKKANFTAARVASFQCEPGKQQSIFWDAKTPGLGLRVSSGGGRAYVFESRLHGKTLRITIGDPRAWDLGKAQTEAAKLKTLVDDGKDPREVRAEQRAAYDAGLAAKRRKSATVSEAWSDYLEHLRTGLSPKTRKPRSENYIRDHAALAAPGGEVAKRGGKETTRGPLWSLMSLRLSNLAADKIAAWLESETPKRPTSAAYAFRMLKAFVRWCEGQESYTGIIPTDCVTSTKVTGAVPSSGTRDGDSLQREQLAAWFNAVRALANPVQSTYLQALLITGARREEMAALQWADVDFQWRSMRIADKVETVSGRVIPLTPYLASLLVALPRRNQWVFSSPGAKSGRIAEPRFAHNQALSVAGLPHLSIHGLRRSFGTLSEWCEAPAGVIAQIQGHKPSAIAEKHYKRRSLDLLRMWHARIEAWMLEQAGIHFSGDQEKRGAA